MGSLRRTWRAIAARPSKPRRTSAGRRHSQMRTAGERLSTAGPPAPPARAPTSPRQTRADADPAGTGHHDLNNAVDGERIGINRLRRWRENDGSKKGRMLGPGGRLDFRFGAASPAVGE